MIECPVCKSSDTFVFLRKESVPTNQHILFDSEKEALSIERGNITLTVCHECMFVFNSSFDGRKVFYDSSYDNSQSYSSTFKKHTDDLIKRYFEHMDLSKKKVLEIGCGQARFLEKLVGETGAYGIGFDPAFLPRRIDNVVVYNKLYKGEANSDVVLSRHTIEHLEDPVGQLLRHVYHTGCDSFFLETPSFEWIIENEVVWDIFYEHCSLFCKHSLSNAVKVACPGYNISVEKVFGGQYMWAECKIGKRDIGLSFEKSLFLKILDFGSVYKRKVEAIKGILESYGGSVLLWGAGAKGVTLANSVDKDLVKAVVDFNPRKIGKYLPGTGHRIIGPEHKDVRDVKAVVLMNPNYREETLCTLGNQGPEILSL